MGQGFMDPAALDRWHMQLALELAWRGQGHVEPNPMVGCVIARGAEVVGLGWHRRYGGPHAEVEALRTAGPLAQGATAYITLEPCSHQGKTPPCTEALIRAGVRRVVAAVEDPFPQVQGRGLAQLRQAGVEVHCGLLAQEAQVVLAPYLKRIREGKPWVVAKWAATWDGKLATWSGHSRWISNPQSRQIVHRLRGRVDAVVVGVGTVLSDDPLLTARPPGPRTPVRVVLDSQGRTPPDAQLVRTASEVPTLLATSPAAPKSWQQTLRQAGCEVVVLEGVDHLARWNQLLHLLGSRRMTNVLVEGGPRLLGWLLAAGEVDEVHVFLGPKLLGGQSLGIGAPLPGPESINHAWTLQRIRVQSLGEDVYLQALVRHPDD